MNKFDAAGMRTRATERQRVGAEYQGVGAEWDLAAALAEVARLTRDHRPLCDGHGGADSCTGGDGV